MKTSFSDQVQSVSINMEFSDDNASLKSNLLRSSFLPSTKLRNEGEVLKIWIILVLVI